jgi:hypothetical protein
MTKLHRWLRLLPLFLLPVLQVLPSTAMGEEGMWPLHDVPREAWQKRYGFDMTPAQIEALQGAAVRVGSSSAWVSPSGLVMTNHHVAYSCIRDLSTPTENLLAKGFYATSEADEKRCPGWDARLLVSYEDVTTRLSGLTGDALTRASATLETECRKETSLSCEVVTLYRGAARWLYRYQRWTDVRLVFAPEEQAGFFGGDTDNFNYPRYALDVAFMRVYQDGKPVRPKHWLPLAKDGVREGDVVLAIGNPRSTERSRTVADIRGMRDMTYPIRQNSLDDQREALVEYGKQSAEAARQAKAALFGLENGIKVARGEAKLLNEARFLSRKQSVEDTLRQRAADAAKRNPKVAALLGGSDPWQNIEAIAAKRAAGAMEHAAQQFGFAGVMVTAMEIVALAQETERPESDRLREFSGPRGERLRARLLSDQPVHAELEIARLEARLQESMDLVGQEHPWVASALAGQTPRAAAARIVNGTSLAKVDARRALVTGGKAAVASSTDAAIVLARTLYPRWRESMVWDRVTIDQALEVEYDRIGQIRFLLDGKGIAPDATGTLRVSVGQTRRYDRDGLATAWMTTIGGKYERAAAFGNKGEFALPLTWVAARTKLDADTPYNWVSTLDTIGGSSGSPIVNTKGEWVGIVFDGNIDGLGTKFAYDLRRGRSVAVDSRAIMATLDHVYGARRVAQELRGE